MPLTGAELLTKIKDLGDAPRDQVAIACGYLNDKTGKPSYVAFYEALTLAKGISLAPPSTAKPKGRGKAPSYEATIAKTGTLPIGGAYTAQAGWQPTDKIRIAVNGTRITLERIAAGEAASSPAEVVVTPSASVVAAGAPAAALAPF